MIRVHAMVLSLFFFFFNDTATTEIYTLSLHDALRSTASATFASFCSKCSYAATCSGIGFERADRKSTRLNSSHVEISYAVFCLKKKNCCSPWCLTGECM